MDATSQSQGDLDQRYIGFRAGEDFFALDIFKVSEIIRYLEPVPVPHAPRFITGVIDLRGTVIPIMDYRARLDLPVTMDKQTKILILKVGANPLGLIIDNVDEVFTCEKGEHLDAPQYMQTRREKFFDAVIKHKEHLYFLLNVEQMLSEEELDLLAGSRLNMDPAHDG